MKKVISISLGSSKRDHKAEIKLLGEDFIIERKGTDGNKKKARKLFYEYDGEYDAFGIGGIDLYIYSDNRRYTFKDAKDLIKDVQYTPVVDGSGLKNSLERMVIQYLEKENIITFKGKKVLMVSAVDRFGMAKSLVYHGADVTFGDLIFGLGLPVGIKTLEKLDMFVKIIAPIITRVPIEWVYPTGDKQEKPVTREKYTKYYRESDIIAGDFLLISKYLPDFLENKIIITNTITANNIEELKKRGVSMIITTTPELKGRSFGTNVIEAVLVALADKKEGQLSSEEYIKLLKKINFSPRIIKF
ncbi:MAG: quinate 5-dehydrogenase [Halanaerobiaceae bacterium]